MEEVFKKEQHARQQVQKETVQGFKNEENARQLVQKALDFMKDNQESETVQWQHCLQRGQYRSGTGVWKFCSAITTFLSVDWNLHSKEDGI